MPYILPVEATTKTCFCCCYCDFSHFTQSFSSTHHQTMTRSHRSLEPQLQTTARAVLAAYLARHTHSVARLDSLSVTRRGSGTTPSSTLRGAHQWFGCWPRQIWTSGWDVWTQTKNHISGVHFVPARRRVTFWAARECEFREASRRCEKKSDRVRWVSFFGPTRDLDQETTLVMHGHNSRRCVLAYFVACSR